MEKNKPIVVGEDLWIFVGYNKETKKLKLVPFIVNKNHNKIKDLSDNEVLDFVTCAKLFCEKYNVKNLNMITGTGFYYTEDETITKKKLVKILKSVYKINSAYLKEHLKNEEKIKSIKEIKETYGNF